MVPCSQAVKLDEDHHLVEFYKCYLNKEIFIPCDGKATARRKCSYSLIELKTS